VITLAAGALEASFAPAAGMVCHSLRHEGEELLAQRDGVEGYVRTGRWMGVPLLHPWANRLADWEYEALGRRADLRPLAGDVVVRDRKTGLPIHGVLPLPWEVLTATATRVVAELAPGDEGLAAAFPFPHRMRLEADLSPTGLRIATALEALEGEVPVVFGFHPWFTLPGATRADYAVELPAMRRLALGASRLPTGEAVEVPAYTGALPARGLDDGFDAVPDGAVFAVAGGGRRIELRHEAGYPCAQVFAPTEKDLICFEPMTARANALLAGGFRVAAPGAPYTAAFTITVDNDQARR
jgi:aldose 1-epimerase